MGARPQPQASIDTSLRALITARLNWLIQKLKWLLLDHGIGFAIGSLLIAASLGILWAWKTFTVIEIGRQTLSSQRLPTSQRFKGIESFVLSKFPDSLIGGTRLTPEADSVFDDIDKSVSEQFILNNHSLSPHSTDEEIASWLTPTLQLKLAKPTAPFVRNQYLTDSDKAPHDTMLFVPAVILPGREKAGKPLASDSLTQILHANPQLAFDLLASDVIARHFQKFTDTPVFTTPSKQYAVQVYLLTRTGILRLWRPATPAQQQINPFNAHRFFPERPLFWQTIESSNKGPSGFDFESQIYVDLGGNGLIRSFCNRLRPAAIQGADTEIRQISDAAICLDLQLPATVNMQSLLDERLKPFTFAASEGFSCSAALKVDSAHCDGPNGDRIKALENNLNQLIRDQGTPEEMFGGIYVLDMETPTNGIVGDFYRWLNGNHPEVGKALSYLIPVGPEQNIVFTVPNGLRPGVSTGPREANLILCRVNLSLPELANVLYLILAILFVGIAFVSLGFAAQARVLGLAFLRDLERVMAISPVPFCHVDRTDLIAYSNKAFQTMVDYTGDELREKTFASLLESGSRAKYALVQAYRERYKMTPPYEVMLMRKDRTSVSGVISGAPVHMARRHFKTLSQRQNETKLLRRLPHTFGILVFPTQVKDDFIDYKVSLNEFEALLEHAAQSV